MATHTVRLHRVLRTSPDRLYRAFIEPGAFERWLPPFGSVVQEGIPEVIPVEMCHRGWQESLVALAQLVEPDVPA